MAEAVFALLISAAALWIAAPVAVICLPRSSFRLALAAVSGAAGGAASCAAGILELTSGSVSEGSLGSWFGLGNLALRVDSLSGFFLTLTGGTTAILFVARGATLPHMRERLHIVALAGLLVSLQFLFIADNLVLFMFGWEGVAISVYLLVASGFPYHSSATDAAQWTMIMTRLGGAAVLASLLCLAAGTHGADFSTFRSGGPGVALGLTNAAFILALLGFGVKMGLLPLQSWLPRAYPAAPLGAPAFLAAVALNAGFYGFIRFTAFLGPGQIWWGLTVLLVGAITAFGGILYAAVQTNLKALIAYSSVENVGVILCGIGASMTGRATHVPLLAGLGLTAALAQIAVHTVAKAALFVSADAVEQHTGTTDMERLGGLARSIPAVAGVFLMSALALIGLPPLGGFVSAWLTLETLMQGFRVGSLAAGVSMAVAGALLALTAAVAGIAFVKAFFATFLGMPRTSRPTVRLHPLIAVAGGALAACGVAFGVAAPWLVNVLGSAQPAAGVEDVAAHVSTGALLIEPAFAHFSSIAPTELAIVIPGFAAILLIIGALTRNRRTRIVRTPLWNSGSVPPQARTQYTPTGWSNPTRVVFDSLLRTRRARVDMGPALLPSRARYTSEVPALIERLLILPPARAALTIAAFIQRLQSGSLSRYVLYVLAVLAAVLVLVPLIH
jgi:formate hydrogenlyase subunit 3/multisubunit Na+/H+ antiporter MnhD subunit